MVQLDSPGNRGGTLAPGSGNGLVHGICGELLPAFRVSPAGWLHCFSQTVRVDVAIGDRRVSLGGRDEVFGLEAVAKKHPASGYMKLNANALALASV